ncbi:MAG: hypothetical protein WAT79_01685 [Saprospiraceae bacterium]
MFKNLSFPGPIPILMMVIILAALATWLIPAGKYEKLEVRNNAFFLLHAQGEKKLPLTQQTLDSFAIKIKLEKFVNGDIRKPVSVPGTFKKMVNNGQGFLPVIQAPIKGIIESVDIILFVLIIGGFMFVFNETGAMVKGILWLGITMKNREHWLVVILTIIFSFLGGSYGMAEEAFVFYPILVPLFVAAGYDVLIPLAIIFGGTSIGGLPAFSNPFSTIIASNAAGINWMDGLGERLIIWAISTSILIWYILKYANKVKKNPTKSLVLPEEGVPNSPVKNFSDNAKISLDGKTKSLLLIYVLTFLTMIGGVVWLQWWTIEMSALFLGSSILIAFINRIPENIFIQEFIKGAESLLSVAFIIGVARGVTVVLQEGHVSDSILYYMSNFMQGVQPVFFIILLLVFYMIFSIFIQSSSGMAVLTMPIIGALAFMVNIPGNDVVNAYMYGMTLMTFVAPTGLILPSLAMVNVGYKTWIKFITPLLGILTLLSIISLIIGIYW